MPVILFKCLILTYVEDFGFKPKLRSKAEAIFAGRKDKPDYIDYEFKIYEGTRSYLR